MLAQRALDAVYGVDVNPFAVAIARFRLIVAGDARRAASRRLDEAPGWTIHVAAGDSLLHGDTGSTGDGFRQEWLPSDEPWSDPIYAVEDPAGLEAILGRQYHVVVGNPPYITVKDAALNDALPRALDDLPPAVFARRAVHRAVLRPGPRRRRRRDRPATSG